VAVLADQIDARSEAELDMEAASSAKEAESLLSPVQVHPFWRRQMHQAAAT
jgi:hypothetical protein